MAHLRLLQRAAGFDPPSAFFVDRLAGHGLSVVVPDEHHHEFLNDAIYEELVHGVVLPRTRSRVVAIIDD